MYKSWKSWKLVLGYFIMSFWKNSEVQEPKTEQFEEFGEAWSRSRLCCSRSRVSQRRRNFQKIAISPLIDRDQTLIFGSAPSGRRPDREQIPVARDQYRDFWKSGLLKAQIYLILSPNHSKLSQNLQKEPRNTFIPSIRAQMNHNSETHFHFLSQNRH